MDSGRTFGFDELNPEVIFRAVETGLGVRCTGGLFQLNSMENRVYEVEIDTGEARGRRLIAKFYRPGRWTTDQIREEHEFLADLKAEDIEVASPLPLQGGSTLGLAGDDGGARFAYAVWEKFPGRSFDELPDSSLQMIGRLVARMHNVGQLTQARHRQPLSPDAHCGPAIDFLQANRFLPPHLESEYFRLTGAIMERCRLLFEGIEPIRIHGDFHLGNLLSAPLGLMVVDFDDMMVGPPVQDLWLLIPEADLPSNPRFLEILAGYEMMRDFDRRTLRLIEPLRALRMIHYAAWVARRIEDPYFKRTFVNFGSDQYWSGQIADLRQQWELIEG